ncbi:ATP-binding cassette domain-containing protein [Streptomyces sp. NPDC093252]|uniref:ATP-binding cassette domain-containing protein n=1 Tax=Streptomyces sp. NPDC093252 TaxID=3154980 RepID=UPI0034338F82
MGGTKEPGGRSGEETGQAGGRPGGETEGKPGGESGRETGREAEGAGGEAGREAGGRSGESEEPLLTITNATIRFGTTTPFQNISLTAHRGETVALDGPSGTGKTTLLRVAAGLLPPSSGTVRHTPGTTRTTLFQDPRLLPWRTVRDNVLYGLGRRPTPLEATRADDLLARLGLGTAAALRPDEISGGMRRRTALARALLPAPDLLLADEPFAHLDPEWSDTVEDLLRTTAASGTAILLTAHQPTRLHRLASTVVDLRRPATVRSHHTESP